MASCQGGSVAIVEAVMSKILQKYGEKILHQEMCQKNVDGQAPIFFACQYNSAEIVDH